MGKPYSQYLREHVVGYVRDGHSARSAGRVFGVSVSTAVRLAAADWSGGDICAKPKARLRRIGERIYDELIKAVGDICRLFSPTECRNFILNAGYAAD